jgi:hypothetical protein
LKKSQSSTKVGDMGDIFFLNQKDEDLIEEAMKLLGESEFVVCHVHVTDAAFFRGTSYIYNAIDDKY